MKMTAGPSWLVEDHVSDTWGSELGLVAQAATDVLEVSTKARRTQVTSEIEGTLLAVQHT